MRQIIFYSVWFLLAQQSVFPQTDTSDANRTEISIHSNIPAEIFLDSISIGITPIETYKISPGTHHIKAISLPCSNSNQNIYLDTINLSSGVSLKKEIELHRGSAIHTEPFGANLFFNDSLIGTSPFILPDLKDGSVLKIKRPGYSDTSIFLSENLSITKILLQPVFKKGEAGHSEYLINNGAKSTLPLYISGGTAIAGGVAAAYLKISADRLYNEYRMNQNDETLSKVKRKDTISAVSLIISQVSLVIFSYLLFSQ
ncbi:MAG: hypothetical protein HY964_00915 [Ignavibacteriales bacterium]|nr:hypothetical protein [Ignavibacteriales bacterium]